MPTTDEAPPGIINSEAVVSAFGYWPSFHDAEVHRVELTRGNVDQEPSATLVVHAFATDGTVDEMRRYRVVTSVLITLRCLGVIESELHDLGSQNVLSCLVFEPMDTERVRVTLGPCFGLWGSLVCRQIRVESVLPWPAKT
jgi:hypothetical protein